MPYVRTRLGRWIYEKRGKARRSGTIRRPAVLQDQTGLQKPPSSTVELRSKSLCSEMAPDEFPAFETELRAGLEADAQSVLHENSKRLHLGKKARVSSAGHEGPPQRAVRP